MPYQEQYQLFRKALFNTLSREEESQLEEARKDPVFDKDFREYLETSSSILRVEEKAAAGREDELAFQYAEQKTNTGENLYVEFRMRHDEEYAQLVADAREFIAGLQEQETSVSQPVVMSAVASDSEPPQQEKLEVAQIPQELPGNMAQTTATVRRLIPRKTSWYGGVAVAVMLAILAGWVMLGDGANATTKNEIAQLTEEHFPPPAFGDFTLGPETVDLDETKREVQKLFDENMYEEAERRLDLVTRPGTSLKGYNLQTLLWTQISIVIRQGLENPSNREKALSLIDRKLEFYLRDHPELTASKVETLKTNAAFSRILILSHDSKLRKKQIPELEEMLKNASSFDKGFLVKVNTLLQILREE